MNQAIVELGCSLLATLGFALMFRAPLRDIPAASLGGTVAWGVNLAVRAMSGSDIIAFFVASIVVGLYAETVATLAKRPATIFITCAIITLVPGGGMYYTMFEAVNGSAQNAAAIGFKTLSLAGAIAAGVSIASAISRILFLKNKFRRKRRLSANVK